MKELKINVTQNLIPQWTLIIEGPGDVTRIRHTRESLPLFHLQLTWYLAPTEAQKN